MGAPDLFFLTGPDSFVTAMAFTVYGVATDAQGLPEYKPLWQGVLSKAQLDQLIGHVQFDEQGNTLIAGVEAESGITAARAQQAATDTMPLIPYSIVVGIMVDRKRAQGADVRRGSVAARIKGSLKLGPSRETPELGFMVSSIKVPVKPPKEPTKKWIFPSAFPIASLQYLMGGLAHLQYVKGVGVVGATPRGGPLPQDLPNVFRRSIVEQSEEMRDLLRELKDEGEAKEGKKSRRMKYEPYVELLRRKVSPVARATERDTTETWREYDPFGSGILRVDDSVQAGVLLRSLLTFGISLCRQSGICQVKSTAVAAGPADRIIDKMTKYGIEIPSADDPAAMYEALTLLQKRLRADVQMQMQVPEAESDFQTGYFTELAKLNPRRRAGSRRILSGRAPREPRKNPLKREQVEKAIEYAASRSKSPEPDDLLTQGFRDLEREAREFEWDYVPHEHFRLTRSGVGQLFPQDREGRDTWTPAQRLAVLERENLVSRLRELPADDERVVKGRDAMRLPDLPPLPFSHPDVMAAALAEAGLSLDDALAILEEQGQNQRIARTPKGKVYRSIQPSSALCKKQRKRKLTGYTPPPDVFAAGDSSTDKVVILMNPVGESPRVMTYRHRTHIDCDLTSARPDDLPALLGRAIQATMFWLVESPRGGRDQSLTRRQEMTTVLVGRVGQPELSIALRPGDPVTLRQVARNLQGPGVAVYPDASTSEVQARTSRDVESYRAAVKRVLGFAGVPAQHEEIPRRKPKVEEPVQEPAQERIVHEMPSVVVPTVGESPPAPGNIEALLGGEEAYDPDEERYGE